MKNMYDARKRKNFVEYNQDGIRVFEWRLDDGFVRVKYNPYVETTININGEISTLIHENCKPDFSFCQTTQDAFDVLHRNYPQAIDQSHLNDLKKKEKIKDFLMYFLEAIVLVGICVLVAQIL